MRLSFSHGRSNEIANVWDLYKCSRKEYDCRIIAWANKIFGIQLYDSADLLN